MRKVLIVSPNFPPTSTPDLHRVRTSLPHYRSFGWEPTVLCLTPESGEGIRDPMLAESLPDDAEIVRVPAWSVEKCRRLGFGHLDYRAILPLYRAGTQLLKQRRHEIVFFSTTAFLTFLLGPLWKRRFGCKVVYDFHDPWFHGPQPPYTKANAPGGWRKYRVAQTLARYGEPFALHSADHIISVSEGYRRSLSARYAWLGDSDFTIVPFGAAQRDFYFAQERSVGNPIFARDGRLTRWVYAGAVVPDMHPVLDVLFRELGRIKQADPDFAARLRLHFVGTNYAPQGRSFDVVAPLAHRHGLGDMVEEHSQRIPYFQALSLYGESDGVILVGSVSPDYTASKLFTCVMTEKPVLALFNARSLVGQLARRFPNVFLASFEDSPRNPEFEVSVRRGLDWLRAGRFDRSTIAAALRPLSAEELTRVQCSIFDRLCIG
jgi:hypothetical protein